MKAIKSLVEMWCCAFQALQVMGALVHNSFIFDCLCPHRCCHFLLHFIPFPSMLPVLSLSLYWVSICISLSSRHSLPPSLLRHYHLHLTRYLPLSICPFLWNKTWIHYSFIQTYLSSLRAALWTLSAKIFFFFFAFCASAIHHSYGPIWKHHNTGECFLAVQALTRVVREAVKIPLGDSPVITIAVPA